MAPENKQLVIQQQQVKAVMAAVLNVDIETIRPEAAREQFAAWDSLTQIRLIAALEEQFAVEFSDEQITGLISYQSICQAIAALNKEQR